MKESEAITLKPSEITNLGQKEEKDDLGKNKRHKALTPYVMGIDEAGRGPVLGPMVYAGAFVRKEDDGDIIKKRLHVDDSKALTDKKRREIYKTMKRARKEKFIGYARIDVTPKTISEALLWNPKYSLNEVSHDCAMALIRKCQRKIEKRGGELVHVYVDTVGRPEKYQLKLQKEFPELNIVVSKKADAIYPIVGAASIVAKVERDMFIDQLKAKENTGSGYPSDPNTKKYITSKFNSFFGFREADHVRMSWATIRDKYPDKDYWSDDDASTQKKNPTRYQNHPFTVRHSSLSDGHFLDNF
mmetsp:Transcript_9414/g.13930  ORF Transcript_9414/g.13930 Transcript_9414/m.13930 type:complete len:301 (+) Transcript_9414:156-1058(+)